jgi:hypothetical protein
MDMRNYRRRLENGSKNSIDHTKRFIDRNFSLSPFFQYILYNGENVEAIVNAEKKTEEKNLLLRPDERIDKGEVVEFNNHIWLVMDFNNDEVYPSLKVRLCNQRLTDVGDASEIPVVAVGKTNEFDEDENYIIETTKEIFIYASYQQAKEITIKDRFIMNVSEYEVIGIDDVSEVYQEKGIIKFTFEKTDTIVTPPTEEPTDDTTTDNGGWGEWS